MAHNSRYERIAQEDDAVSLQTVSQDYNYNSGVPNSPPPSFRSTTTPLTPATLRSLNASCAADPTPPYPSTNAPSEFRGGGGGGDLPDPATWSGTAVEAPPSTAATIMGLHTRIARLEESLGRLLLERESWARDAEMAGDQHNQRSNCCANLPDDHSSLRTRNNCCVNAVPKVSVEAQERRHKKMMVFIFMMAFLACLFTWLVVNTESKSRKH